MGILNCGKCGRNRKITRMIFAHCPNCKINEIDLEETEHTEHLKCFFFWADILVKKLLPSILLDLADKLEKKGEISQKEKARYVDKIREYPPALENPKIVDKKKIRKLIDQDSLDKLSADLELKRRLKKKLRDLDLEF